MIYDKYRKKIDNVLKVLNFIKKYKIAIISILSAIIVSVSGLLIARGTVTGSAMPVNDFIYGDVELDLNSKAFLSKVTYEFKKAGEEEWTEEEPSTPGNYLMRARAKGAFGTKKYSDEYKFTIHPRPISFAVQLEAEDENGKLKERTISYEGYLPTEIIEGSLVEGEVFEAENCRIKFIGLDTEEVSIVPIKDSIKITRASDKKDVTDCYEIKVVERAKKPEPIHIVFAVNGGDTLTKTYDGVALKLDFEDLVNVKNKTIVNGDKLEFDYGTGVTNVKDGEIESSVKFIKAVNSDEVDVTDYYDVTIIQTTMKILPRDVSVSSTNISKVYDGEPIAFTAEHKKLTTKGLLEGETITPEFDFTGKSLVNVSDSADNDFEFTISNSSGIVYDSKQNLDTNSNYNVTKTVGTISITPLEYKFIPHSHEFTYNASEQGCGISCDGYGKTSLGHDVVVVTSSSPKATNYNKDNYSNLFSEGMIKIVNGQEDVTENYKIVFSEKDTDGNAPILTIIKRDYTLTSHSHAYTYDGYLHGCADDTANCEGYGTTSLGHSVKVKSGEKSTSVVNYQKNGYQNVIDKDDVQIFDGNIDVTYNYNVNCQNDGILTINKRSITIEIHSHTCTYDGQEHGCGKEHCCEGYGTTDLGHEIVAKSQQTIKEVGEIKNELDVDIKLNGESVKNNYIVNFQGEDNAKLKITKHEIVIHTHSHTYTYDGYLHGCVDDTANCGGYGTTDLGHRIVVNKSTSAVNAGTYTNEIDKDDVQIFDGNIDVTGCYNIVVVNDGELTINKRAITVDAHNHTYVYDGNEHGCLIDCLNNKEVTLSSGELVGGHSILIVGSETAPIHVGEYENLLTFKITDGTNDLTDNYQITHQATITIVARKILIATHDHTTCTYDGNKHGCTSSHCCAGYDGTEVQTLEGYNTWISGYRLEVVDANKVVNVFDGEISNNVTFNVYDAFGVKVFGEGAQYQDFIIELNEGILKVNPREIEFTAHSHTCTYDGNEHGCFSSHCCNGYTIGDVTSGSLVENQRIEIDSTTKKTLAGSFENVITVKIYDADGKLIYDAGNELENDNYLVSYVNGELTIEKRQITITSHEHSWGYDGKEHNCELEGCEYNNSNGVSGEGLVESVYGHKIVEYNNPSKVKFVTDSGTFNEIEVDSVVIKDKDGNNVTANYEITYVNTGTLNITPRELTVYGISKNKIYDGYPLEVLAGEYDNEKTDKGLAEGDTITSLSNGLENITNVWESGMETKIINGSIVIKNSDDEDVTGNYSFIYEIGKLVVNPRPITIQLHSHTCTYDGIEHACGTKNNHYEPERCDCCSGYTSEDVVRGDLVGDPTIGYHYISIIEADGRTNVGEIENNVTFTIYYDANGNLMYDDGDQIVKDNYLVSLKAGKIKVNKRPINIKTNDGQKIYDATAYSPRDIEDKENIDFARGDYLEGVNFIGDIIHVNQTEDENNKVEFDIKNPNGESVYNNYDITWDFGKIIILQREITIKTEGKVMLYDGTYYERAEGDFYIFSGSMATGDLITDFEWNKIINAGTYDNRLEKIVITYFDGTSVTYKDSTYNAKDNYKITWDFDKVTVNKRTLKIETVVAKDGINYSTYTKTYDGLLENTDIIFSGNGIADGQKFEGELIVQIFVKDSGEIGFVNGYNILYEDDLDEVDGVKVIDNYDIEVVLGVLNIEKRDIIIKTYGGEKVYDGTKLGSYAILDQGIASTDTFSGELKTIIHVKDSGLLDFVNGYTITHRDLGDAKDNYQITEEFENVNILQRELTITTVSENLIYNGKYYIRDDSKYDVIGILAPNEEIIEIEWNNIINHGVYENRLNHVIIRYFNGEEINYSYDRYNEKDNYKITWDFGIITVDKRTLKIETVVAKDGINYSTYTKTYDGLLENTDIIFSGNGIADGQKFEGELIVQIFVKDSGEIGFVNGYNILYEDDLDEVDGVKVIDNYDIEVVLGVLNIEKRDIIIKTYGGEKVYDGTKLGSYAILDQGIASTDTFSGELKTIIHVKDSGLLDFVNGYTITHRDLGDAKDNYQITEEFENVNISQRELTITTVSDTKVYDGLPYQNVGVDIGGLGLAELEEIVDIVWVEIVNVPGGENKIQSLTIRYRDGSSATYVPGENKLDDNYDITFEFGNIEVTPRDFNIIMHDHEYGYDDNYHGCSVAGDCLFGYEPTDLGHVVTIIKSTKEKEAGTYDNDLITVKISNGEEDVTYNYNVSYEKGTIIISSDIIPDPDDPDPDDPENPDGPPIFPDDDELTLEPSGSDGDDTVMFRIKTDRDGVIYLRINSRGDYEFLRWAQGVDWNYAGVEGEKVNPLYFVALALQENGFIPSTITIYENTDLSIVEKYMLPSYANNSGTDSLSDVCISKDWDGTISYTLDYFVYEGQEITLDGTVFEQAEKIYREYVHEYYTKLPLETKENLLRVAKEKKIDTSSATLINDIAKLVSEEVKYNLQFESDYKNCKDLAVFFFDEATDGICQHYATAATALYRALGIPARYTTGFVAYAQAGVLTDVKDSQAHAWVEVYFDGIGWIAVEVTGSGAGNNPIFPGPGDDIPEIPEEEPEKITLHIKPKDEYGSAVVYNKNNPLKASEIVDQSGYSEWYSLIKDGYTYEATFSGENYTAGTVEESHIESVIIKDPDGNDVTSKYNFNYESGNLELSLYYVYIDIEGYLLKYNGEERCYNKNTQYRINQEKSIILDGFKVEFGDFTTVKMAGVGEIEAEELLKIVTVKDIDGNDITEQCSIEFSRLMRVEQREITVVTGSATKIYDGEPLTKNEVVLGIGELLSGHKVVGEAIGSITGVGTTFNTPSYVKVFDKNGKDVSKYYNIKVEYGTLEVTAE